ncbi:MAG: diaminopimelate epimerase [Oscillospiraceae bacterium]|nr:diaminopimelate epimerase [Oscillospiraceae bacterium]
MEMIRMNGAGNSFFVLEDLEGELRRQGPGALARQLCRPEEGEKTDGMIVIIPAEGDEDFGMLFYNADGSMGEMCGNGARCAARYGVEHGLVRDDQNIRFRATAGEIRGRKITEELYEVRLNSPTVIDRQRRAATPEETIECCYVELGDPGIPHAVVRVGPEAFEDLDTLRERGRALRYSEAFPKGANVTFVWEKEPGRVKAITFERGVEDFTLACGTGAGATAVSLGKSVEVKMPGGTLQVELRVESGELRLPLRRGPHPTSLRSATFRVAITDRFPLGLQMCTPAHLLNASRPKGEGRGGGRKDGDEGTEIEVYLIGPTEISEKFTG